MAIVFEAQVWSLRLKRLAIAKHCNCVYHCTACLSTVDGIWWMANDGGVAFRDRSLIFFAKRRQCRVTLLCLFFQRWLAKGEVVPVHGKIWIFLPKWRRCHVTVHCLFSDKKFMEWQFCKVNDLRQGSKTTNKATVLYIRGLHKTYYLQPIIQLWARR